MGLKVLTKNISYLATARILTTILSSGAMIFLARYLKPEKLGIYAFVVTTLFFLGSLSDPGVSMFLTKEMAQDRGKIPTIFSRHLTIQLLATLSTFGVFLIVAVALSGAKQTCGLLLLGGIGLLFNNFIYPFATVLTALENMKFNTLSALVSGCATVVVTCVGIILRLDLHFFILLSIIPSATTFAIAFVLATRHVAVRFSRDADAIKGILKSSLPFFALSITGLLYSRLDLIMLKLMDSNQAAGLYNAAYKILFFLFVIPVSIRSAIYPMLANYHANHTDKVLFAVSKTIKYLLIIAVAASILIFLHSDLIISILFGSAFQASSGCLRLLIWMFPLYCGYVVTMFHLNSKGDVKLVAAVCAAGLLANILLNLLLIPAYSILGAAAATLITECLVLLGMAFKSREEYLAMNQNSFIPKLLTSGAAGLVASMFPPACLKGLAFILCFSLLLFLLKTIDAEEKHVFQCIFHAFMKKFMPNKYQAT